MMVEDTARELEHLHLVDDPATGLVAAIAIHSTVLGPAAGGCRFWSYADSEAMIADAARLARGMRSAHCRRR